MLRHNEKALFLKRSTTLPVKEEGFTFTLLESIFIIS